jgi:hypothetical protein
MRFVRIGLVGAMAVVALGTVGAAQAVEPCGTGRVCIYGNNDFAWKIGERDYGRPVANIAAQYNDEMDSWINRLNSNAAWYDDANGGGGCHTLNANSNDPNVSILNTDDLSSWKTNGGC